MNYTKNICFFFIYRTFNITIVYINKNYKFSRIPFQNILQLIENYSVTYIQNYNNGAYII